MVTSKVMIARCRWVKRHHPGRGDLDPLAGRRPPDDVAAQHAVAEVQRPLVVLEVGDGQQHRLVVDVELDRLVVGDVDDGLPDPGEAERLLGVPDRPGLVEAVDEGAVGVGLPTLLDVAAHAQIAVADGEQGLGDPEVLGAVLGLGQRPLVDREPVPVQRVGGVDRVVRRWPFIGSTSSARSATTMSAPASVSWSAPDPAVDPDDQTEAAGPAGLRRRTARPRTPPPARPARRAGRPRRRRCRAPACRADRARRPRCRRRRPRTGRPDRPPPAPRGRSSTSETTAILVPRSARRSSSCDRARDRRRRPRRRSTAEKNAFFRLPRPQTVSSSGPSAGSPSASVMPRESRNDATPS